MENKLNKWFEAARHNPPMISSEEVGAMISNPRAAKSGLSTLKKTIFMGTLLFTIYSWLYWMNSTVQVDAGIQPEQKNQTETLNAELSEAPLTSEHFTKKLVVISETKANHREEESGKEKEQEDNVGSPEFSGNYPSGKTNYFYNPTSNVYDNLQLTNEELAGLGIITDGNVLEYKNVNGLLTNSDTVNTIFHLYVEEHGSKRTNKGHPDTDGKVKLNGKLFWPAAIQIITNKDTDLIVVESLNKDWEHPFFNEVKKFLIPVLTSTTAKPGKYSYDLQLIFWFKPETYFFEALPVDMAKSLALEYSGSTLDSYKRIYAQYTDNRKGVEHIKGFDSARVAVMQKEYLSLSKSELEKLNIKKLSDGVKYENRFVENGKINEIRLSRKGYYTNLMLNDKMFRVKRIRKRDKTFAPVAITNPELTQNTYMFVYPDSIGYGKRHDMSVRRFNAEAENLISIQVDSQTVFWFPETEAFVNSLPERIQKQLGVNISSLNHHQTTPLKYIELTDEQLDKLGIKRNPESITVPMHTGNGKYLLSDYSSKGTVFHFNSMTPTTGAVKSPAGGIKFQMKQGGSVGMASPKPEPIESAYPSPSLITEGNGLHWLTYQTDEEMSKEDQEYMIQHGLSPLEYKPMVEARKRGEAKLAAALNTYIALKVKSNEKPSGESGRNPDLIIWYKPDSLLFATLPNDLSAQIQRELANLNQKQSESGCQFFESCQSIRGSIGECSVYPNPTNGPMQLKMDLAEPRRISVFVTDVSGKRVKDILSDETKEKDVFVHSISLDELAEGMYLLHVTTNKGEYIVQRVVKKG